MNWATLIKTLINLLCTGNLISAKMIQGLKLLIKKGNKRFCHIKIYVSGLVKSYQIDVRCIFHQESLTSCEYKI